MIDPPRTTCDFCSNEIDEGAPHVAIQLPMPASVRDEVRAYFEREITPKLAQSPLAGMISGMAEGMIPTTWKLEVCVPCAYAILPNVREKVIEQIRAVIERRVAAARRSQATLAEV